MSDESTQRRRLILMRHGDAEPATPARSDHGRELADVGKTRAHRVGVAIADLDWKPGAVLVSDSARTLGTWRAVRPALGPGIEPASTRSLYLGGETEIVDSLARVDDAIETVLLIGHNPGLSWMASRFSDLRISLSPGNAALLEIAAPSWCAAATAGPGTWDFVEFVRG